MRKKPYYYNHGTVVLRRIIIFVSKTFSWIFSIFYVIIMKSNNNIGNCFRIVVRLCPCDAVLYCFIPLGDD